MWKVANFFIEPEKPHCSSLRLSKWFVGRRDTRRSMHTGGIGFTKRRNQEANIRSLVWRMRKGCRQPPRCDLISTTSLWRIEALPCLAIWTTIERDPVRLLALCLRGSFPFCVVDYYLIVDCGFFGFLLCTRIIYYYKTVYVSAPLFIICDLKFWFTINNAVFY